MSREPVVLVTGATGRTGRHVVSGLLAWGARVRALVRNPAYAALPGAVELVHGDLRAPETVTSSAGTADAAFLLWPGFDADGAGDLISALAHKARRIVYLSAARLQDGQLGAMPGVWSELERLVQCSGADWTFVRAGGFASNTLGWSLDIRQGDVVEVPFPEAGRSLVHERDVADVAVRALLDDRYVGRSFAVTGPQVLTQVQQVQAIGQVLGRRLEVREKPAAVAHAELASFMGEDYARQALSHWATLVQSPERVTDDVRLVTGRPARPFTEWVEEHVAHFTAA